MRLCPNKELLLSILLGYEQLDLVVQFCLLTANYGSALCLIASSSAPVQQRLYQLQTVLAGLDISDLDVELARDQLQPLLAIIEFVYGKIAQEPSGGEQFFNCFLQK